MSNLISELVAKRTYTNSVDNTPNTNTRCGPSNHVSACLKQKQEKRNINWI